MFNYLFKSTHEYKSLANKLSTDIDRLIVKIDETKKTLEESADRPFREYKETLDKLHSAAAGSEKNVARAQFKLVVSSGKTIAMAVTGVISTSLFPPSYAPFTVGTINAIGDVVVDSYDYNAALKENTDNLGALRRFRNSKNIASYVIYDSFSSLRISLAVPNVSLKNSIDSFDNFLTVFNNAINAVDKDIVKIKALLSTSEFTNNKYTDFLVLYGYISQFAIVNSLYDFLKRSGDDKHTLGNFTVLEPKEISS